MKIKTALKQSKNHVKNSWLILLITLVFGIWINDWKAFIPFGIVVIYVFVDIANIIKIQNRAKKDPNYLDKKIQ